MIQLESGSLLISDVKDLPDFSGCKELFLDTETTSFQKERPGYLSYHGDRIAGIAVTADEHPDVYYLPIRHTDKSWNLPLEPVQRWLRKTVSQSCDWINHNIIFDAHFCAADGAMFGGRLIDTLTLSKLIDSDRFDYDLKTLFIDWLKINAEERDRLKAYLKGIKSKNYADAPADILGGYACKDVRGNRLLWKYIKEKYDESMKLSWDNEIKLTPVLFDIEDFGMPVDPTELKIEKVKSVHKQIRHGDRLRELTGGEVNPASHKDVFDVLCNQFSLPVLATNEDEESNSFGNPSFDKDALALYLTHPSVLADKKILETVKLIKEARDESHFCGLFLDNYLKLNVDGILHPSYNQCVRTGRMSCKNPNAQQLNKRAKALVHPRKGMSILSCDYSQIEFRLIVHYIQDQDAIKAYNENPLTDFHAWVASICGVKRKAAKCLNFGMGFGAGKAKVVKMLMGNPDVIAAVAIQINEMVKEGRLEESQRATEFKVLCKELAENLYNIYHEKLPGIKATSRRASDVVKARGYVFNGYGRRRYLDAKFCYKGFNSIVQSFAADIMKDTTVKLAPRYNKTIRDYGINIFGLIHDDNSMMAPTEVVHDPIVQRLVKGVLEDSTIKISVPIVMDMGFSDRNWAEASADDPVVVNGKVVGGPITLPAA